MAMARSQRSFPNGQRPLIQQLALLMLPLLYGKNRQVIEKMRDLSMLRAFRLFLNLQRPLIQWFRLLVLPLLIEEVRETAERIGHLGMRWSPYLFPDA